MIAESIINPCPSITFDARVVDSKKIKQFSVRSLSYYVRIKPLVRIPQRATHGGYKSLSSKIIPIPDTVLKKMLIAIPGDNQTVRITGFYYQHARTLQFYFQLERLEVIS